MAKEKNLIYVVDDDANIRNLISVALKDAGFETMEFANGLSLLEQTKKKLPALIILDWMMPDLDGLAVCGRLKLEPESRKIPIIMITAKTDSVDCILGLEMGADDYLKKPLDMKELVARVSAILRRKDYTNVKDEILTIGNLTLNLGSRMAVKKDPATGAETFLQLTMKEFDLLVTLIRKKGNVMTRPEIMRDVWSDEFDGDDRTVDVHVRYLRKKIEDSEDHPFYVKTVRGIGYRIVTQAEIDSASAGASANANASAKVAASAASK
jgi:two-component system alkaline phosphatase synthesis response regulator PhoP